MVHSLPCRSSGSFYTKDRLAINVADFSEVFQGENRLKIRMRGPPRAPGGNILLEITLRGD